MEKIRKRIKEEEKEHSEGFDRRNNISKILNSCFEEKSIDEEDNETILNWACLSISNEQLFYLFDKIKFERLK